jgi:hypothetical protein
LTDNGIHALKDSTDKIKLYKEVIKDQIGYEALAENDKGLLDDIVMIMLDVLVSTSPDVLIEGEKKPRDIVQAAFWNIDSFCVQNVIQNFKNQGERIVKKRQYLLTMLYNSRFEINADVENWLASRD